jgi:hypothetical protein
MPPSHHNKVQALWPACGVRSTGSNMLPEILALSGTLTLVYAKKFGAEHAKF